MIERYFTALLSLQSIYNTIAKQQQKRIIIHTIKIKHEQMQLRARILVQLRYIVGFWLVEMAISTNQKPTIYRNL